MTQVLRVGIVGCGAIAQRLHALDLYHSPNAEIVACCDTELDKARELAERYGTNAQYYADFEELLADPAVQGVVITLPNHLHAPVTIAAAEAGKHVLVEKPMATSSEEAQTMVDAAKKAGVMLMVNQNQRRTLLHRKAKEVIDSGIMGRILHVTAMFGHGGPETWSPTGKWFFDKERARFGAMADLGVHKADLVRYLTGKEVAEIAGFYERLEKDATVEDNFVSSLKFTDGTVGTLCASWTVKGRSADYTILHCANGTLFIKLYPDRPLVASLSNPECEITFELPQPDLSYEGNWGMDVGGGFARACLGLEPPYCTGEDSKKSLEIILAAEKSADTRQHVKLQH